MAKKSKAVKKVKAEKVAPAAKKVAKGNGKGKTWKEGSTASLILAAVTSKPLADKEIFAAVKKDLAKKSDNPIARVKRVLAVSAQRALIIKTEDGKYKTK